MNPCSKMRVLRQFKKFKFLSCTGNNLATKLTGIQTFPRQFSCMSTAVSHDGRVTKQHRHFVKNNYNVQLQSNISTESFKGFVSLENPALKMGVDILQTVHDTTGLPWWGTILISSITCRMVLTFPLLILTNINIARLELLLPQRIQASLKLREEFIKEVKLRRGSPSRELRKKYSENSKKMAREFYIKNNCHPAKSFASMMVQLPLWLWFSLTIRNMARVVTDERLKTEGLAWFSNLTVPDPTFILPVTMTVINLCLIEVTPYAKSNVERKGINPGKIYKNFLRGFMIIITPVAIILPSGVTYFWLISSSMGLAFNILLTAPKFRRLMKIPKTPKESDTPFRDILDQKKNFFRKFVRKKE